MRMIIDAKLDLTIGYNREAPSLQWSVVSGRGIPSGRFETQVEAYTELARVIPERIAFAHSEIARLAMGRADNSSGLPAHDETLIAGYANGILHARAMAPIVDDMLRDLSTAQAAEAAGDDARASFYMKCANDSRDRLSEVKVAAHAATYGAGS